MHFLFNYVRIKTAEYKNVFENGEFETFLTAGAYAPYKNKTKGEKMKRKAKRTLGSTRSMTRGALIAALYVGLCYVSTIFGLSSGAIQFRLAEVLCILPIFMPEAIVGLFVGCILSNIIAGCVLWDIIFGSVATLIGAIGAYLLRGVPEKIKWVATLPNLISNMIIVPFVLMYAYGLNTGFFALSLSVGIGEAVCGVIGGTVLYYSIKDAKFLK